MSSWEIGHKTCLQPLIQRLQNNGIASVARTFILASRMARYYTPLRVRLVNTWPSSDSAAGAVRQGTGIIRRYARNGPGTCGRVVYI